MKPNEPSRTALMIARQRAAHQLLDRGAILDDPFALKILGEDEKDVLQFANAHPAASLGRLFTAARSRIAEDALAAAVGRGIRQVVILGAGLDTFALRSPHNALELRIYEVDHPATQQWKRGRLAEAKIAIPPSLIFVPIDFERDDMREAGGHRLSPGRARVFQLARRGALSQRGSDWPDSGLHRVHPEIGGGVRLHATSGGILRRATAIRKRAERAAQKNGRTFRQPFRSGRHRSASSRARILRHGRRQFSGDSGQVRPHRARTRARAPGPPRCPREALIELGGDGQRSPADQQHRAVNFLA